MTRFLTPALLLGLLASLILSLSIGSASVAVFSGLIEFLQGKTTLDALVIGKIRLPRTLLAMAVGAALGLSGAALQGFITERNQLKLTAFYTRLRNEIYLVPIVGVNTNLDKSHKYGLELQDRFKVTEDLTARINYAYTVAKIDREDEGNGAYNGKKLPGVSAHSITAGLDYRVLANGTLSLTQNWRSRAYAMEDFANVQRKQKAFNSTDIGYSHNFEQFTLFAHVSNVFDKKNGVSMSDDVIYPVNFTRTWHAGARISF